MTIKIVGSGCNNCKTLLNHTKEAVKSIDGHIDIEYVTDIETIAEMGLLRTPGFIIDDQVVTVGQVLKPDVILGHIKKHQ